MDVAGMFADAATGGLIGGILRFIPEILKFFQAKADRAHELAMRELDWRIAKEGGEQRIREIDAQGSWEAEGKRLDALRDALTTQMRSTGIWVIDVINMTVRPVITYYFALLYGAVKLATFSLMLETQDVKNAILLTWTPADSQAFFGILGFWFIGRIYERGNRPS